MTIYKILQQCLNNKLSLNINVFNKYQTYFLQMICYQKQYYLFLNNTPIDLMTFISYLLIFETFIADKDYLYSDCFVDYKITNSFDLKKLKNKEMFLSKTDGVGIEANIFLKTLNTAYQNIQSFNAIIELQKYPGITGLEKAIYHFLTSRQECQHTSLIYTHNFFKILAKKLNANFYQNRPNLLEIFGNTLIDNQDLIVYFNLKDIFYEIKFSFTDVNNLEAAVKNFKETYIGSKAFALLYIISVFYNEDYERTFVLEKVPSKITHSNRQILLEAYLLNELINQNKENNAKLMQMVHDFYGQKFSSQTSFLLLIKNVCNAINSDSEFQDYSQDKTVMRSWLKKNADTLLGLNNFCDADRGDNQKFVSNISIHEANNNQIMTKDSASQVDETKKLTRNYKLIYWSENQK